jgi:hypothetical protein
LKDGDRNKPCTTLSTGLGTPPNAVPDMALLSTWKKGFIFSAGEKERGEG